MGGFAGYKTSPNHRQTPGKGLVPYHLPSVRLYGAERMISSLHLSTAWTGRKEKKVVEKVAPNGTESPNPCDIRFHCAGFGKLPKGIEMIQTSTVPPHQRFHPSSRKSRKGFLLLLSHAQHAAGGELSFCDVPPTLISLTNKINKNVSPRNST